jgi:preprotein translocase subunit Sss1
MTIFTFLYSIKAVSIQAQVASPYFYLKVMAHCLIGIFIIGYIGWKEIIRKDRN